MDHIIEARNLVKIYPPDIKAVDDITFYVDKGEIFGFLGPNGAGKSTTIKILITLISKTSGQVQIDGHDLESEPVAIRHLIGYASQEVGVDDDLTAKENLRLQCEFHHVYGDEAKARVDELIRTVGLEEAADRRAGTFSGGMRKRLDLATSLVSRPKILFLDEPTTGLDPQSRQAIWDYIRKLNREGMTIFLTTQQGRCSGESRRTEGADRR
jgi:ABC-2 type transport system ATP-binding protein